MIRAPLAAATALLIAGCGQPASLETNHLAALPEPVTNNAVAAITLDGAPALVSLMGLGTGRTHEHVHASAWLLRDGAAHWETLPDVPGPSGRLAGVAVGIGPSVYLFGGYTVAADGSESSVELVQRLDAASGRYETLRPMPVPVDDAVALPWRDRWIYLVSGWHDHGNVNLVQVYDTVADHWSQATPFPGAPVFGHAGGIVGDRMVICDGVAIRVHDDRAREFAAEAACYLGTIDTDDPARIDWRRLPHHGGPATYRMAAAGSPDRQMVIFAGGSDNPYNYDGIGYDGRPSRPSARVFGYNVAALRWIELGSLPLATMDHRGLPEIRGAYLIVGGMRADQQVGASVFAFRPSAR